MAQQFMANWELALVTGYVARQISQALPTMMLFYYTTTLASETWSCASEKKRKRKKERKTDLLRHRLVTGDRGISYDDIIKTAGQPTNQLSLGKGH